MVESWRPISSTASLRWHDPDQVQGVGVVAAYGPANTPSQSVSPDSPSHLCGYWPRRPILSSSVAAACMPSRRIPTTLSQAA